jgi:branched-chain amino acid transport system ATP-binding protein
LHIADRGYLIETGRIVGQGTAATLRDDPAVQRAYLGIGEALRPRSRHGNRAFDRSTP